MQKILAIITGFLSPANVQQGVSVTVALAYALALPAIWLLVCLWLNRKHPHRAGFLTTVFFLGALAVMPTLPVEQYISTLSTNTTVLTVLWAASEELLKFVAFILVAYKGSRFNGPRDYAIAAVTAGLGFAGLENALYVLHPVMVQNISLAALSGGMRFIGADLLHGVTTGAAGIALGFAYFKTKPKKVLYAVIGITFGVVIHSTFNLSIGTADQAGQIRIFEYLWLLTLSSIVYWYYLSRMEAPKYIETVWTAALTEQQKSFAELLAKLSVFATDQRSFEDIFKEKGISAASLERISLAFLKDFLTKNYALHLRKQGLGREDSEKGTAALVNDSLSPKTASFMLDLIGQKDAYTLGTQQIEVFAKKVD